MTSPCSSPRISRRSVSRLSSAGAIRRDYNIFQFIQTAAFAGGNISASDGSAYFLFRLLVALLARVGQHRNAARLVVQLQHRQHLEAVGVVDAHAEDDQVRLHALDLRVGVLARFDEDDVVVTGVEHRFEHFEHLRAAVDDDHFLRGGRGGGVLAKAVGGCGVGHHRWSVSGGHSHQFRIRATRASRRIPLHFPSISARAGSPSPQMTTKGCSSSQLCNPLSPRPFAACCRRCPQYGTLQAWGPRRLPRRPTTTLLTASGCLRFQANCSRTEIRPTPTT